MGERLISPSSPSNNNSNNLLMEKADLIMVMDYNQEYDQEYYDQEESSQYDDQYDEGYESYNVKVTALDINTANCFKEFEEEITPVPEYNLEPVDQPSSSSVTTEYSHSQWNSNSGEDQQVMDIC
ncbi:hypothetical protein PISMIDRAFT_16484 [Pisolithus microcarpus 441]|uniref:Uncharacterized protein n=1 Tax=Pisolithus microcarpus 441 TaxID=765257 RepID=A0A0C9XT37_9AGAM|nr:hypothetical protein PISMIDRAFT_16484 [Pisolithus microcarpus 441]